MSPLYLSMIYVTQALLFNNVDKLTIRNKDLRDFRIYNEKVIHQIFNDCLLTFNYELSFNQMDATIAWFLNARDKMV